MKFKNPRQIVKYQTDKKLIEFNNKLSPASPERASNIHAGWSKINVVGIDYTEGKGEKAIVADANLDPATVKYLFGRVIIRGDKNLDFSEQKVLTNKTNEKGEVRVTLFSVKYNEKMRYPWGVKIENGFGIAEKQPNGGTSLQRGSYRKEKAVNLVISEFDFEKIIHTVTDFIRHYEQMVLPEMDKYIKDEKNFSDD